MLSMSTRKHEYGRQTRDEAAEVSPRSMHPLAPPLKIHPALPGDDDPRRHACMHAHSCRATVITYYH